MKNIIITMAALGLLAGTANIAMAQDTTVIHKESADGDSSKTVVKHASGAKTVIKRHGSAVKKVHTDADGDKTTIIKKTGDE